MQIFKKPNFKFMQYKYFALALSGIIIMIGLINITAGKGLNYGIDFAGGTLIRIKFQNDVPIEDVRGALTDVGLGNSIIQAIEHSETEYMIRTPLALEGEEIDADLEAHEKMGALVIEALMGKENTDAIAKGQRDLNSIGETELILLLETSFPDEASNLAKNILGARVRLGIFKDFEHVQTETGITENVLSYLRQNFYFNPLVVLSKESVGPQIGHDLRNKATQAAVWAMIGMLIYIGLRFKFAYGIAAIITLAHDVLITVGIFSLTNREINLPVIAAIMTIIGYSLNDTIVIFDRVRDNIKLLRKLTFSDILDSSINQTLSRTIITSGTTFLTVFALFVFGGNVINDFAFTIMIGVIIGTYSSIYQSCSMLFFWNKFFKPKKGMGK